MHMHGLYLLYVCVFSCSGVEGRQECGAEGEGEGPGAWRHSGGLGRRQGARRPQSRPDQIHHPQHRPVHPHWYVHLCPPPQHSSLKSSTHN